MRIGSRQLFDIDYRRRVEIEFIRWSSVKLTLERAILAASVVPVTGAHIASACSRVLRDHILFLKSIYAGIFDLIGKAFGDNIFVFASKIHKLALDESIVTMYIRHFEIVRVMNRRGTLPLTKRYPNLVIKYFGKYLARSFSKKSRREILKFHHQYLMEHVTESFYEQIFENGSVLWNEIIDDNRYTISLAFNSKWHMEGDLSLIFSQNDIPLYEISFTVVPGRLINDTADQALLVGRVQGARQQAEAIRTATRACRDIAPPHLLMAAAQSIAGALAIDVVGGVSNKEQLSKFEGEALGFFFDYDAFWETFVVKKRGADIYEISVPFPQKPFEQIKIVHRRRTRLKRRFKNQIAASVGGVFAEKFLKTQSSQKE